jgi:hypothetical protein
MNSSTFSEHMQQQAVFMHDTLQTGGDTGHKNTKVELTVQLPYGIICIPGIFKVNECKTWGPVD